MNKMVKFEVGKPITCTACGHKSVLGKEWKPEIGETYLTNTAWEDDDQTPCIFTYCPMCSQRHYFATTTPQQTRYSHGPRSRRMMCDR